ncbi:MAG: hypothetical protein EAZ30_00150 [Betaproteobacteria bacterium]|nr:MAG: hypothetical protein EAZ30_00150 [Betaproteobacteria bacterium]
MTTLLFPPDVAIVRTRIPGFASLNAPDQRRAAAFALQRDLGVDPASVLLATRAMTTSDDVSVAFASAAKTASASVPTRLLQAVNVNQISWFGAPAGFVIGPDGAAAIEHPGEPSHALPAEILSMLSAHSGTAQVTLIDAADIPTGTLELWHAASGVPFVAAPANDNDRSVTTLEPVTSANVSPRHTSLDRALLAACVASVICVSVAVVAWATNRGVLTSAGVASTSRVDAGALLSRIVTISPELRNSMKSATYGGNAWVIALSAPAGIEPFAAALRNNGLVVQVVTEPEARLRVSLP